MLEEVTSNTELVGAAGRLLLLADVREELPTPVDTLVQAAGLVEPNESLLSDRLLDQAPGHLKAIMSVLGDKIIALLDRQEREIHIRPGADASGAFKRLHEVGHHIIPWQRDLAYADSNYTLSWETNALFELEASRVAAELLFQQDLFTRHAASRRVSARSVHALSEDFGASIHSTFRRYVETHARPVAGVVLRTTANLTGANCHVRQEAFCSGAWRMRFLSPRDWPHLLETGPYTAIAPHVTAVAEQLERGTYFQPLKEKIEWPDLNGELHPIRIDVFTNTYRLFVMLHPARRR